MRSPADYYPTPAWCVHRLLEAVALPGGVWFDPCAGDGAIIRAVNEVRTPRPTWAGCEIRPACAPVLRAAGLRGDVTGDFLSIAPTWGGADVVLTNPPYSLAEAFIRACRQPAKAPIVAMLLRLNFIASQSRVEFWRQVKVPDIFVLPNRPDFSGGGGDACEYAWFVWHSAMKSQVKVLATTPKAVRVAQKPKLVKTPDVEDLIA